MDNLSKILDVLGQVLTVIVIVVSVIAFLCRQWISEWIKSHFSKAVGRELEVEKHKLNRELEAYKGSLLRELEQFKANIDIKRSIALKMADARLEALRSLAYELDRYCTECSCWPALTPQLRQHNMEEFNHATEAVRNARRASAIFLPIELVAEIADAIHAGRQLIGEFPVTNEAVLASGDECMKAVMQQFILVIRKVKEQIHVVPAQLE